jgi:hypothetical protein
VKFPDGSLRHRGRERLRLIWLPGLRISILKIDGRSRLAVRVGSTWILRGR